ncbi:MAG: permease [Lachnospiraceae bacterium]|nr:permease [Lachnospiraceae bacterium]
MDFINEILSNSVFQVFIVAVIGYILGSITIKGIEIGDAGILIVALVAGHFGVQAPAFVNDLGVVLFVASVGLIAGPKFFHNFAKNVKSYVLLGFCIILAGTLCTILITVISGIDSALSAGLMSGALTSTPGLAAAQEAAAGGADPTREALVSVGYGIAYPFGVIGVVLFVQLMPKVLKVDMAVERKKLEAENATAAAEAPKKKWFAVEHLGMMPLCLTVALGVIIGKITIPLPGGASFALGTSGGPLLAGLIIGHFGHIGPFDQHPRKSLLECMREFGLILFLIGAGTKGGAGFVNIITTYGPMLFVYGAIITLVPMVIGYLFASKVLKLPILNNMGALCGGMTSTPALGTLIQVTGTDDVATAYASTYPIALVAVVLFEQLVVLFF